jgi:hypothetical protein
MGLAVMHDNPVEIVLASDGYHPVGRVPRRRMPFVIRVLARRAEQVKTPGAPEFRIYIDRHPVEYGLLRK